MNSPPILFGALSLIFSTAFFSPKVSAVSIIDDKVKIIAEVVRLKQQGNLSEAKSLLQSYVEIHPEDEAVVALQAEFSEVILSNRLIDSTENVDQWLSAYIDDEDRMDQKLLQELSAVERDLDSRDFKSAEFRLMSVRRDLSHVHVNQEFHDSIRILEGRCMLEKAYSLGKKWPGKAKLLLDEFQASSFESDRLKRLEKSVVELLEDQSIEGLIETDRIDLKQLNESQLCRLGKQQCETGDFDHAIDTLDTLKFRFPTNRDIPFLESTIVQNMDVSGSLYRARTREQMLHEVHDGWRRPRIFSPDSSLSEGEHLANPLVGKIRKIKIPRVHFSGVELTTVIETLSELSVEFDPEIDPLKKGVNIVPLFNPNERSNPKVSISLRNLSLEKILQFVTQQVHFQFDIGDEAIVVQPTDGPDGSVNLLTEFYSISRATVIRLNGGARNRSEDMFSGNPFEPSSKSSETSTVNEEETFIKSFFQRAGVEFDGIRGASLAFDGTQLIVTQTSRNLERMRNILRRYEKTRQVEIEAKFLEVQQSDLEELGFNWIVKSGGKQMFDPNGNPILSDTGSAVERYDTQFNTSGGNRSLADGFALNQSTDGTRISSPGIVGGELFSAANPPAIPRGLDFAESVAGGILSSIGVLGEADLGVVIRALSRKEGSDLMSAPRLTVLSGKTANITVAQELRYPESYGDINAEVSRGRATTGDSGGGAGAVAITAGTPQNFTVRNVGVEMEVTPTVEDNDNISLVLQPKVTEFEGFVEYGGPSVAISGDLTATVPSGFYQPIFSTRSVKTEVTIYDGATVVIGGLTREEIKAVDDKVPLLGDLPFIGRLFRSEGETTRKKNLLIFVTANLIGPGGGPIKQRFPDIEANSMFQNPTIHTPQGGVSRRSPIEP